MVIVGASLTGLLLIMEYFKAQAYYGPKQLVAVGLSASMMFAGAAWEALSGRRSKTETLVFWALAGYVALLLLAFRVYSLESRAFQEFIGLIALFGFIVNHYLPFSLRKPFFLVLSFVSVVGVFGVMSVPAAAGLIVIGLALIGICHLPIPTWGRIALLLTCGAGLALIRTGWVYVGWAAAIVPILASMFMFRSAIYLYDVSTGKGPTDIWSRLSYFFMFPNFVFPFFPIVDYTTFGRTYYNDDALRIYHRGATFIFRGLVHLLMYRVVYFYFTLVPDEVNGPATFLQWIVSNFALYLRISGLFHLIVGLLLLFGFNLHETHSRFYFSNSFMDLWRRMNVYWKDFMQKMLFNPAYLQLKRLGVSHMTSVILSMVLVFAGSWLLHAYQWFWLSGTVLFTIPDVLFWVVIGICVIGQTLHEARPKKAQAGTFAVLSPQLFLVVRTVCTLLIISLLWSLWTSSSVASWLALVARSDLFPAMVEPETADVAQWLTTVGSMAALIFMAAVTAGVSFGLVAPAPMVRQVRNRAPSTFATLGSAGAGLVFVSGLLAVQVPALSSLLSPQARQIAHELTESRLNALGQAQLERGYYEGLVGNQFNAELWEFYVRPGAEANTPQAGQFGDTRWRNDYLGRELVPNAVATIAGLPTSINRWGFNDPDYPLEKPERTRRIALIGSSRSFGWGVQREDRFDTALAQRLNQSKAVGSAEKYEILNFSVPGYMPMQRLLTLEEKVLQFRPDVIFYEAGLEARMYHHAQMVRRGVSMPYEFANDINRKARVDASMSEPEIDRRLQPYRFEFLSHIYRRLSEVARQHGIPVVWIYVPDVMERRIQTQNDVVEAAHAATAAGFITVDLTSLFVDTGDQAAYRLSRWDSHPNSRGHRLVADALYERLSDLERQGTINLGLTRRAGKN
jgi:D-alanyl-lipoteichoic acid acyltransferase DltB (MBOAT superfamily)